MKKELTVLSLFAGGGIAETYYHELGIRVAAANLMHIKKIKIKKN